MSKELLEIVKPIIEPQILLREQNALEKGIQEGIIKGAVDILKDLSFLFECRQTVYCSVQS